MGFVGPVDSSSRQPTSPAASLPPQEVLEQLQARLVKLRRMFFDLRTCTDAVKIDQIIMPDGDGRPGKTRLRCRTTDLSRRLQHQLDQSRLVVEQMETVLERYPGTEVAKLPQLQALHAAVLTYLNWIDNPGDMKGLHGNPKAFFQAIRAAAEAVPS